MKQINDNLCSTIDNRFVNHVLSLHISSTSVLLFPSSTGITSFSTFKFSDFLHIEAINYVSPTLSRTSKYLASIWYKYCKITSSNLMCKTRNYGTRKYIYDVSGYKKFGLPWLLCVWFSNWSSWIANEIAYICHIPSKGPNYMYRKRPNKRPGRLLGCPVSEEGEGAFIKMVWKKINIMTWH